MAVRSTVGGVCIATALVTGGCTASLPAAANRSVEANTPVAGEPLEAWIDSVVAATMVEDRIPGAAVVWIQADSVMVSKAYGLADVEAMRPVTLNGTVFRIGSTTKLITALAMIQLIDRGRIGLDEPVGAYLPDLATASASGAPVLVRHLLSHSGGYDQVGARRQVTELSGRPTLRSFLERELVAVRRPGRVGVYDTYGITLAGHLVEQVSGLSYGDYLRRNIFEPLGMQSSWVEVPEGQRERLAVGYGIEDGRLTPQTYEWYVTLPASSVDATVSDMGRLLAALLGDGGGIVSPAMMERVRSERLLSYGNMGAFSWGFWEEQRDGYRALHHGGIMRGYSSELYLVPEADVGFFVAYNRDVETGPPARLREALTRLLHERVLPARQQAVVIADESRAPPSERVAGVYGNTVGCFSCTEGEGWPIATLSVAAEGRGVISLYGGTARFNAADSLVYVSEASGRELRFLTDDVGRVRYMVQGPNSFARLDDALLDELLGPGWRERPPEPIVARVYRATGAWAAAAAAYASLAARDPVNGRLAFYEGFSRLHTGEWSGARDAFQRALDAGQWSAWSRYYIAAAYAGEGDDEAAWTALDEAMDMGFSDANLLRTEPWWQELRESSEYQAVLQRLTAGPQ
jgi:CubicO group peptidase (beta-lactamase class C family)